MKVEIWSDVMCPFCYIGKRKFEAALEAFPEAGQIEVEWRSFQLDPTIRAGKGVRLEEYLAEKKGWTLEQATQINHQVSGTASAVGLDFHLEKAVVANTFDAHRVLQLAKKNGVGDTMEEKLFNAYFKEGKDVSDHATLTALAVEAGMDAQTVRSVLESGEMADEVRNDIKESQQLGVRGVPFFVLNRKYGISGAQPSEVFLQALQQSFGEWIRENGATPLQTIEGAVCTPDGACD